MIFTYGPLVWDTERHNRPCPGSIPVDYNNKGIPIDNGGNECLPLDCIIHPGYKPTVWVHSDYLDDEIPSPEEAGKWFKDNFYHFSEEQIKNYVIRWIMLQNYSQLKYKLMDKILADKKWRGVFWESPYG